jgi:magnesium chelatase family protein
VRRRGLSARAVQSLRRVARTVADLEGAAEIGGEHLAQALALRAELT